MFYRLEEFYIVEEIKIRYKLNMNRRKFILKSTIISGAAGGMAVIPAVMSVESCTRSTDPFSVNPRSLKPKLMLNGTVSLSKPRLAPSQLSFRIGLARTRMASYPCDSMDFVMMDLERPDNKSRQAHWCNGDLTGRLLEFLCCSEGVDGKNDPRLDELFERILKQKQSSGYIGRFAATPKNIRTEDDPTHAGAGSKHFIGLLRYYELTRDERALEAALGLAELLWSVRDEWKKQRFVAAVIEPMSKLWEITNDPRWMEFCELIRANINPFGENKFHSHGYMTTIRGLQNMSLITGDLSWNEIPDRSQRHIIEKHWETPDGNIPESFPTSARNEGCSISDWMLLNLYQGLIKGDDSSYDKAERIFWNALAFNQLITGGFGHRRIAANGYGADGIQEAWWCCTQNGGMAMSEYARHTVTFRNESIHVNFLTPGEFEVPIPGNKWIRVKIKTSYPNKAEATIESDNIPDNIELKIRIPACVNNPQISQIRDRNKVTVNFQGEIGHRIEQTNPGVILTYGPLILIPPKGVGVGNTLPGSSPDGIPEGYVPQSIPPGIPIIKLENPPDANGFIELPLCPPDRPLPTWSYYDEGPGSRTWIEGAAAEVSLKYPDGRILPTRFIPMCFSTSCLALVETPVVFQGFE